MKQHADIDQLVAYADGEIDAQQAREIEKRLIQDPAAQALVGDLREGAALLRAAFSEPLHEALPSRLHETIDREIAARRARDGKPAGRNGWLPLALAASVAALVVGLSASYFLTDRQLELALVRLETMERLDRQHLEAAINRSLEMNVSGVALDWQNPDTGSRGLVTPIRTFKSKAGQWCREYEATLAAERGERVRRAIACRTPEGLWATKVELTSDS